MAHLPEGTLVAIAGGKDVADPAAVIRMLDKTRAKHGDMVLVHGGGPGVEKIAARWAERNGIDQVVCKPDWDRHGRAAPFRRNDELLNLLPKGVIAFPGSGITDNLVDKRPAARHPRLPRGLIAAHRRVAAATSSHIRGNGPPARGGAAPFRSPCAHRRRADAPPFVPRGRFAPRSPSALPIADAIAPAGAPLAPMPRRRLPRRDIARSRPHRCATLPPIFVTALRDEPAVTVPDTASNGSVRTSAAVAVLRRPHAALTRRGGSDPPLSPATIPQRKSLHDFGLLDRGAAVSSHPTHRW